MKNFIVMQIRKLTKSHENSCDKSINSLPLEIFNLILSYLTQQDKLKCRLISSSIMRRVDSLCHNKITLRLSDKASEKYIVPRHWNIVPSTISVEEKLIKKISKMFVASLADSVTVLELSAKMSSKNFHNIVSGLPLLQTLTLNSMTLGDEKFFPGSTYQDTISDKYCCSFNELYLKLGYIQCSEKYFSTQSLISNLLGMHRWNVPNLTKLSFEVRSSMFSEQFYFTYDLFLMTIPKLAYRSLKTLEIVSPRMRPFKCSTYSLRDGINSIQLKTLIITSLSSQETFSPAVIAFIQNQHKLSTLKFQITESRNPLWKVILTELWKINPNVIVEN